MVRNHTRTKCDWDFCGRTKKRCVAEFDVWVLTDVGKVCLTAPVRRDQRLVVWVTLYSLVKAGFTPRTKLLKYPWVVDDQPTQKTTFYGRQNIPRFGHYLILFFIVSNLGAKSLVE